ncbi:MAG: alpha-2-macroglobulin [Flavipsychrobacter sp.]
MKSYTTLFHKLIIVATLLLASCASNESLKFDEKQFKEDIGNQENLYFSFNKDIYPDSLVGRWDTTAYISFSPNIPGSFKWNSSSELVFSPSSNLLPETKYEATLNSNITRLSKNKYKLEKKKIQFSSTPLKVTETKVSWTRGQNRSNIMIQLDLDFNYNLSTKEALKNISLIHDGQPITTTNISKDNSKKISLQFTPLNELDDVTPFEIEINKGITIADGNITSSLDTSIKTIIPSRFTLAITNINSEHTGEQGIITINTTQPVIDENLKKHIVLEPAIPFEVETSETGIHLTSDKFSVTSNYDITISKDIEGRFGGVMKTDFDGQITFKKLSPSIQFTSSKGMYLSTKGNRNIGLSIINTNKVKLRITKIYENNISQFIRRGQSYRYDYDDDDYHSYYVYNTRNIGDEVFAKEYNTQDLPRKNGARILNLDFKDKIKSFKGTYLVEVQSQEHTWVQDSKILNYSDVGLIVKEDKDNIYVFANSIRNATPLQGVRISFISTTNQLLEEITTNSEGTAILSDIKNRFSGFNIGLVTAKMEEEFSFISLENGGVETSRFNVGGYYQNSTGLNAMIYAERNLYRPGEQINVSTIIRNDHWASPGEIPVKMQLTMPNGKEFATNKKILDKEGSCETHFNIPPSAITGTYTLHLLTGNNINLATYDISIEDFVPDRIKTSLTLDKEEYQPLDSIKATLQVDNLFGTPAVGRNYEAQLNISKKVFKIKSLSDYDFNIKNDIKYEYLSREGKTDKNGTATFKFPLKKEFSGTGILQGNIMATAFDETGRPVHRYSNFTVYTQPIFIGIKHGDDYVNTKKPHKLQLVAVDQKGGIKTGVKAKVSLIKIEWHSVIERDGNGYRYKSKKQERVLKEKLITINGQNTNYIFTPELSGQYEVRISPEGSDSYVSRYIYAWGYYDTEYTSFEVNTEGNVTIKTDKEKYNIGDNIDILFTTPFEGRMLVTLERDNVIEHKFLTTKDRSASFSIKAGEKHIPNIYVSATLFRPMDDAALPLTVAHGYKSISVENKSLHIPVAITVPEKSRSKTKQTIKVKTTPNAFVTIAAVDEGILQVKNYKSPDPYTHFYQKHALGVKAFDVYPYLMPEINTTLSSTGGDGADESAMRANPLFVNRIKNVSYWSGIKQADANGNISYDIDIPQFSGDLRVMALAYKGSSFGNAESHVKIADPIVISTALPRFLSPKDEVLVAVTVSNTTNKSTKATIALNTNGPLGVNGDKTKTVTIGANNEERVVFNISAENSIGKGKVDVTVKALNEAFENETEIAVRPPAGLQKKYIAGSVKAGSSQPINIDNNFMPQSIRGQLIVSKSPLIEFTKDINDLIRYPYGCIEQTTSTAFPQLYYYDLVKSITSIEDKDMNPGYNVREAIQKIQSMQQYNGGMSYWQGGGYESWWGTIYATHFLIEAQKAGFKVSSNTIKRSVGYMEQMLKSRKTTRMYYNNNQYREIASKEIPYSLFVLALAGSPQYAHMNYYKAHQDMLSLDGRYMLAAAYALSGQKDKAQKVLPKEFAGEESKPTFGGSFYSYIRDLAISLYVIQEINPDDLQISTMSRILSEKMRRSYYLNTQEKSFGILALGKIAQRANKTQATANIMYNSKSIATTNGKDQSIDLRSRMDKPLQLKVEGKGQYYYFAEASGITKDGSYAEEDKYLKVRRSFYTKQGRPITNNTFKQNDLIVVEITLQAQYDTEIENVVVTDILPAGFEVENSRLFDMPDIKWTKEPDYPQHEDFRDDRVNLFTSASKETRRFYYMVRAVTPGTYIMGPVQADAMYNGAFHSYHGAGTIKVLE